MADTKPLTYTDRLAIRMIVTEIKGRLTDTQARLGDPTVREAWILTTPEKRHEIRVLIYKLLGLTVEPLAPPTTSEDKTARERNAEADTAKGQDKEAGP